MYQHAPGKPVLPTSIYVKGNKLEGVDSCVYRGRTLSRDNTLDE